MSENLIVNNITKSFVDLDLLRGVSFELERGKISGLIGPSGCGKSVLLKILGGVIPADGGKFDTKGITPENISLMFQEGALFDSLTVFDNVAFPLVHGNVPTSSLSKATQLEVAEKVMAILAKVGLSKAAQKMPAQLSGGMKRRVSLARAVVSKPDLVLLDDPTCGLDPVASGVIMNLIKEMQEEYQPTVLLVSQDLRRLFPKVDKIIALSDGKIEFEGSLNELREKASDSLRHFVSCRYDLDTAA